MKKIFGFLLTVLIIYVIYIDLSVGTLPSASTKQVEAKVETIAAKPNLAQQQQQPYFDAKVKPGDTVISIVEHHINKQLPVSISDLITDFQKLNPENNPEKIQIGATYHFPDYSK